MCGNAPEEAPLAESGWLVTVSAAWAQSGCRNWGTVKSWWWAVKHSSTGTTHPEQVRIWEQAQGRDTGVGTCFQLPAKQAGIDTGLR